MGTGSNHYWQISYLTVFELGGGADFFSQRRLVPTKIFDITATENISTGKSLSEAFLFAEHVQNILCTKIVLNFGNNFCTQHVLPRFELGIFMY